MRRSLAILVLALVSGAALHLELDAENPADRRFTEFPWTALVGTFATAIALRLGVRSRRRSIATEVTTALTLFALGTLAFAFARWGLIMIYAGGASHLPMSPRHLRISGAMAFAAIAFALVVAIFGWTRCLRPVADAVHRRAPFVVGALMLAVLPSAFVAAAALDVRDDLLDVIASGLPAFFTVVYAACAARLGTGVTATTHTR